MTYIVRVVHTHEPAPVFIDLLVAAVLITHSECRVHVNVVA